LATDAISIDACQQAGPYHRIMADRANRKVKGPLPPMALITRLNRKLAGEGIVVGKKQVRKKSDKLATYYMLDTHSGTTRYLSLNELENLGRELGVLALEESVVRSPILGVERGTI
jgi:hypothetical protein